MVRPKQARPGGRGRRRWLLVQPLIQLVRRDVRDGIKREDSRSRHGRTGQRGILRIGGRRFA